MLILCMGKVVDKAKAPPPGPLPTPCAAPGLCHIVLYFGAFLAQGQVGCTPLQEVSFLCSACLCTTGAEQVTTPNKWDHYCRGTLLDWNGAVFHHMNSSSTAWSDTILAYIYHFKCCLWELGSVLRLQSLDALKASIKSHWELSHLLSA